MKLIAKLAALLALAVAFSPASVSAESVVKWPGGRMAITSDGNAHDKDDIGGTPMSLALLFSAGLQDKLVHVDYANHFAHEGHKGEVNKPEMMQDMVVSTEGAAARFGRLDPAILFNCQTQLDAATRNFVRQALRSSATDPLWFICAGPMTTANRYLDAVKVADPAKLAFIRCVSHSANNGRHDPTQSWERMKREFPTVTYVVIANQNGAGGKQGLCSPLEYWEWLKNSPNPNLQWLSSRNRTATVNEGKFDVSDAGMVYYVLSGAGNERAGAAEFRALLEQPRANAKPQKPNIVFVLVDDQRNTSLGCAGHPQIKTPVIDRLAAQGVRFINAFAQTPICMASRANLFTGLTTTTHGYHGNPNNPVRKEDLDTSFPTLLRQAGYQTAFYGKQHVNWEKGVNGMTTMFDDHEVLRRNPYLKKMPDGSLRHVDEIIGDKSVAFVQAQSAEKPFFLYMSFNISHAEDGDKRPGFHYQWPAAEDGLFENIEPNRPNLDDPKYYLATPDFLKTTINRERYFWGYDTADKYRTNMRALYRMLAGMDRIVGRVMTALKEKGFDENTVVIYSADNGYYMGDRGFQGKWSHYDQSLHVPLIVSDPRMKSELRGRVLKETATSLDIPATILDLATVPVPSKYQGATLRPLLDGAHPENWRSDFYAEHHAGPAKIATWFGVRDDRYTYANYYANKVELLYDRERDPTELTNVAADPAYADVFARLRQRSLDYKMQYTRTDSSALASPPPVAPKRKSKKTPKED